MGDDVSKYTVLSDMNKVVEVSWKLWKFLHPRDECRVSARMAIRNYWAIRLLALMYERALPSPVCENEVEVVEKLKQVASKLIAVEDEWR